ncbi:hypothetical protein GCM10027449_18380 [Sinomonas notoginsengisoli]
MVDPDLGGSFPERLPLVGPPEKHCRAKALRRNLDDVGPDQNEFCTVPDIWEVLDLAHALEMDSRNGRYTGAIVSERIVSGDAAHYRPGVREPRLAYRRTSLHIPCHAPSLP